MTLLSAIPVTLLVLFLVWFIWPILADTVSRVASPSRRGLRREADRTAETLFAVWSDKA